jgi:hypothetical protein
MSNNKNLSGLIKALTVSIVASLVIPGLHFIFLATGLLGSLRFSDIWFMGIAMPLWPSSIFLMATASMSVTQALPIIAASVGVNMVLYCIPGTLIWLGWSRHLYAFKLIAVAAGVIWIVAYCVWLSHATGWV